jgi:serine/threonine-protein kinase
VQLVMTECADPMLAGRTIPIDRVPFTVGRSPSADLCLSDDPCVSRLSCAIELNEGMYWVRDLGSANGTFLNGRRIADVEPLYFGVQLRLSTKTSFVFTYEGCQELPDLSGCVIESRYELKRLIRTSAKAVLYAASDRKLPHEVAIKLLSPHVAAFSHYTEQFRREAALAAKLQHPHICGVMDSGVTRLEIAPGRSVEVHYLCSRNMPGGSLAERLAPRRDSTAREDPEAIPLGRTVAWIMRLAEALDYAHRNHVVHRGIKPSSIIFDAEDNPYLSDFAIAYSEGTGGSSQVVGAPAFLAPEQWEGRTVTPAVDQYALAALAYLLVTGSRPHEGQEHPDVRKRNFAHGPNPAHAEAAANGRPDVPRSISAVLSRALSIDPEGRYPSVLEFGQAFQQAARGGRGTGKPRIFISYQRDASSGWAVHFEKELRQEHGIDVFVDTLRRDTAGPFPERLRRAIEDCDVFVCLLDRKTLDSKWVQREILLAHERKRRMVPIFQERYRAPEPSRPLPAHVQALLDSEGLHLLDRRNIHVQYTIAELARMVRQAVGESSGD